MLGKLRSGSVADDGSGRGLVAGGHRADGVTRRAALSCALLLLSALWAAADDLEAEARAAIAANCERCHPPLPDGGWQAMTARPHDHEEMVSLLRRMAEEYSAFPSPQDRVVIIEFLSRFR
jgi:hypothetical protein